MWFGHHHVWIFRRSRQWLVNGKEVRGWFAIPTHGMEREKVATRQSCGPKRCLQVLSLVALWGHRFGGMRQLDCAITYERRARDKRSHTCRRRTPCNVTRVQTFCSTRWNGSSGTLRTDAAHRSRNPPYGHCSNTWTSRRTKGYTRAARRRRELHAYQPPAPTSLSISSMIS